MKATITYDIVNPESAENGDTSENGWYMPGGYHYPLNDESGLNEVVLNEAKNNEYDIPLSLAIKTAIDLGCSEIQVNGNDISVYTTDGHTDFKTGNNTNYCLHIKCKSKIRTKCILNLLKNKLN